MVKKVVIPASENRLKFEKNKRDFNNSKNDEIKNISNEDIYNELNSIKENQIYIIEMLNNLNRNFRTSR